MKNKRVKYISIGALGLLIIGLASGFVILGKDSSLPEDSDLRLPKIEVQKEENAYFHLSKIQEKIYWPSEKAEIINNILQGKEWDDSFIKELLENNEEAFSYFEKALACPKFQFPEFQDIESLAFIVPMPSLGEYRQLARLEAIRALYLFNQGQEKEAFDQAVKVVKIAHLIQSSPRPTLIQYLVGVSMKKTGTGTLRMMIPNTTLPPDVLKKYIEEIADYRTNTDGLAICLKADYTTLAKAIDNLAKGNFCLLEEMMGEVSLYTKLMVRSKYSFKPNQTKKMFAEYCRKEIANLNKNYYSEIEKHRTLSLIPYSLGRKLLTENLIGKAIYETIAVNFALPLFEVKCQDDFSIFGTQILMAIRNYQIETGKMPISLNELVPKYVSEIPKDPFDGKPIRFSSEKKIIYSIGSDLKDSGGSKGEDWTKMEDPTFEIKF